MTKGAIDIGRAAFLCCALTFMASAGHAIEKDSAASACLSGPKGAAPAGQRWYYRVDRATKKNCWYTRAADPSRNVASRKPTSDPVEAAEEPSAEPLQPAVANARAEAPPSAFAASPASVPLAAPAAIMPDRALADRFADHPDANRPAQSRPAMAALPTQQPAASPAVDDGNSFWLLIGLFGGVIGVGGLAFGAIRRFASPQIAKPADESWDDDHWDDEPAKSPPLARNDDEISTQWDRPPMNWVRTAREHADRQSDEIGALISRKVRMG